MIKLLTLEVNVNLFIVRWLDKDKGVSGEREKVA